MDSPGGNCSSVSPLGKPRAICAYVVACAGRCESLRRQVWRQLRAACGCTGPKNQSSDGPVGIGLRQEVLSQPKGLFPDGTESDGGRAGGKSSGPALVRGELDSRGCWCPVCPLRRGVASLSFGRFGYGIANFPQISPQLLRNFSQLDLTLPDRNAPTPIHSQSLWICAVQMTRPHCLCSQRWRWPSSSYGSAGPWTVPCALYSAAGP